MSGHSKWATTKRQKFAQDAKRSSIFSRLANAITIAAREKGGDSTVNISLRLAIEKAKQANMPKDNIERATRRGTGEGSDVQCEEIIYEGYGPGGAAVLVHALTDNRNRTVSELKHLFSTHGGTLGSANSVAWMFERRGIVEIAQSALNDNEGLALIEAGVQDIIIQNERVLLVSLPDALQRVRECARNLSLPIASAQFEYAPTTTIILSEVDRKALADLIDTLNSHTDVVDTTTNEE